jgi:predicted metalloprotease with PDZ domain
MNLLKILIIILLLLSCSSGVKQPNENNIQFHINLNDRSNDRFKVTVFPKLRFTEENVTYNFVASAQGSYQVMDIGRFVDVFKAYDHSGRELKVKKQSINKWKIFESKKIHKLYYEISETWDSNITENIISEMCGTSIEDDHALINGQAVFGYFSGFQETEILLSFDKPKEWEVASSIKKYRDNKYYAKSFTDIVHSPILMGKISYSETSIANTRIKIYSYSKNGLIHANQLLGPINTMLEAAEGYMTIFPVKEYTFLFHFEDKTIGAWEHPNSSTYVWEESEFDRILEKELISVTAHEFFHTLTPLSIRSEKVADFNYEKLNPSEHLWFYEGVTEWASEMMLLRAGKITQEEYLERLSMKYVFMQFYNESYSLSKISLECFSKEGQEQYGNIYQKGALVAGLLDIALLEGSDGKYGLRELVLNLLKKYGKDKPFSEKNFLNEINKMTLANLKEFIDKYIKGNSPLNLDKFYQMIGFRFHEQYQSDIPINEMGLDMAFDGAGFKIENLSASLYEQGLRDNDVILAINGKKLLVNTANEIIDDLLAEPLGSQYSITIRRRGKKKSFKVYLNKKLAIFSNIFLPNEAASEKEKKLQEKWLKNLIYE